jgi:hypothetical protein
MAAKTGTRKPTTAPEPPAVEGNGCFVIMPISDVDGYAPGHFHHVYNNLIVPACEAAGFAPRRAGENKGCNLIQLEILKEVLAAPMAVCDLSARNPNVLFELAIRQAFDKPVALIQEIGTPPIFDIAGLRCTDYHREMMYHQAVEERPKIAEVIRATYAEHRRKEGTNSIVRLLALNGAASLPSVPSSEIGSEMIQVLVQEVRQLRSEMRHAQPDFSGGLVSYRPNPNLEASDATIAGRLAWLSRLPDQLARSKDASELGFLVCEAVRIIGVLDQAICRMPQGEAHSRAVRHANLAIEVAMLAVDATAERIPGAAVSSSMLPPVLPF